MGTLISSLQSSEDYSVFQEIAPLHESVLTTEHAVIAADETEFKGLSKYKRPLFLS